jgi:NAD(P)-dependent dehydrogenase (short-subunit alcohol dehydrogenase family)
MSRHAGSKALFDGFIAGDPHHRTGAIGLFAELDTALDQPIFVLLRDQGNWEYTATKYGLRGFMKTVRRSSWEQGIRINYVCDSAYH